MDAVECDSRLHDRSEPRRTGRAPIDTRSVTIVTRSRALSHSSWSVTAVLKRSISPHPPTHLRVRLVPRAVAVSTSRLPHLPLGPRASWSLWCHAHPRTSCRDPRRAHRAASARFISCQPPSPPLPPIHIPGLLSRSITAITHHRKARGGDLQASPRSTVASSPAGRPCRAPSGLPQRRRRQRAHRRGSKYRTHTWASGRTSRTRPSTVVSLKSWMALAASRVEPSSTVP